MKYLVTNFISDRQLYQYIMVGGIAACVDIAGFLALNHFLQTHYLVSASISFVGATLVNYLLCSALVFKHPTKYKNNTQLILTYFVSAVGLSIHHSLLWSGIEIVGLPIIVAKLLAMGCAFFWNFLSRKYWVFQAL